MLQDEFHKNEVEISKKGVQITFKIAKLTLQKLVDILKSYLENQNKQSVKKLIKSGNSLEQINIAKSIELKAFAKYAKKCGIYYSVLRWSLMFKEKDRELINKFIKDFVNDWEKGKFKEKTSISEKLRKFRAQVKKRESRRDKVKFHRQEKGR